ncbi:MAG: DEAD/DEAH box helicase [Armatimonadota bacterium]
MDFNVFLNDIKSSSDYLDQIVYVREIPAREAEFAETRSPLSDPVIRMLRQKGIEQLYTHQAQAVDLIHSDCNPLIVTGTASGKSICYLIPIIEMLHEDKDKRMLLLFPTKALCQDQFRSFSEALEASGVKGVFCGVFDSDTPAETRRRLRDHGSVIFTNPDMLHSALMSQHGRWADFLSRLKLIVIDEMHTYNGVFGSNMANLFRRFARILGHYGAGPNFIACSATINNPVELAEGLMDRVMSLVEHDGSPRGKRTYVFWNPPRARNTVYRSRRSANVEAHELMAALVQIGAPTITFSKAKMTAEMIYRYVCEKLRATAPNLISKMSPYRGGYIAEDRREIEKRLFNGELLGVSSTRALELGIDVGGLDACIIVGYPGTLASFFQQSGRAGRTDRDCLIILIGLDTSINQYIMTYPEYIFDRPIEQAVIDPDNPYVITGHLRCATHEIPLADDESTSFGPFSEVALRVLEENMKLKHIDGQWFHAASETPQHEVSLRGNADKNVMIEDVDTGMILGEINKFDAPPILHPGAIYMHRGDTYLVLSLDLVDKNIARVTKVDVDYYTQPIGGTDVHHIDNRLREKPFGTGMVYWGEVTSYFSMEYYEKVHFYELDTLSVHGVEIPKSVLETMAVWIVPSEELMKKVLQAGLNAHSGLRGIGYATRMLLPLFMTCDTLDLSHSIGSVNSPWNAIFIYERYPHGLGFTEKAYDRLHEILPLVLKTIKSCDCDRGCPCCVGKPLRQYATWNVERDEASIPNKHAAIMILEGLLDDGTNLQNSDTASLADNDTDNLLRLEKNIRRRLERMREPQVYHSIEPVVETGYPDIEKQSDLPVADVEMRVDRRISFNKELRKRIEKKISDGKLDPLNTPMPPVPGRHNSPANVNPRHFPGKPVNQPEVRVKPDVPAKQESPPSPESPVPLGDSLASKARKLAKKRAKDEKA